MTIIKCFIFMTRLQIVMLAEYLSSKHTLTKLRELPIKSYSTYKHVYFKNFVLPRYFFFRRKEYIAFLLIMAQGFEHGTHENFLRASDEFSRPAKD